MSKEIYSLADGSVGARSDAIALYIFGFKGVINGHRLNQEFVNSAFKSMADRARYESKSESCLKTRSDRLECLAPMKEKM